MASNTGSEGIFINNSDESLICLKDVNGCITSTVISPGRMCQADAVYHEGYVFKIPNHTAYSCNGIDCAPIEITSWLIMQFGKHIKRGPEHYEVMELYEFLDIVGEFCL